jgi:predicted GH43/DUF377 family glycosyl hydrolase
LIPIDHHDVDLFADPSRVVLKPFAIPTTPPKDGSMSRTERIVRAVLALSEAECAAELAGVDRDFHDRHWTTHAIFLKRFEDIRQRVGDVGTISETQAKLIGAYFSHEYSYAAAAIMNPSIVAHPDQTGMREGAVRFVMSLRTVGEGHISSIAFREGIAHPDGGFSLWPEPPFAIAAAPSAEDASTGAITLHRHESASLSGTVIFPATPAQANGVEDLRLVRFLGNEGKQTYLGTYTAYSGREIGCELMQTDNFVDFQMTPLRGEAATHKGLALFPRRIGGKYAAIGRLDQESLYFLCSDDLLTWNAGERILEPAYPWELIQLGNCGSPIEVDEGWLLLTHGVGAMRQYSIGAALLDLDDPSKVIGRTRLPLLRPLDETREGYVPNVVYTCGGLKVGSRLFIPYGVADSRVRCASVDIDDLVAVIKR